MFNYLIPIIVIIILIYGLYKKVDIFDTFLLGVKEGLKSSINLFPTIFAMIIAINLLTNSGFILDLSNTLKPLFNKISFLSIKIEDEKCVGCHQCTKACKMDVNVIKTPNHPECIRCGACMKACPKDAIHYQFIKFN